MGGSEGAGGGVVKGHNRKKRPRVRILIGSATALGPGKADLLDGIGRLGSISAAARALGMSYRRAWQLVDTMNHDFKGDLVRTATGGRGGGGARVTALGLDVLRRYREMEAKAEASVSDEVAAFAELLTEAARQA
jgi:molybdate transport system regulatory protein